MHKARIILLVVNIILLFALAKLIANNRFSEPTGGEICVSDIKKGVDIYVEEGYSVVADASGTFTEAPHSFWKVTDTETCSKIVSLCKDIRQYRQFEKAGDIMLGDSGGFEYLPHIYLVSDGICYKIEIFNRESFSGEEWSGLPILHELEDEPILHVFRIDLSSLPDGKAPFLFAKEFFGSDSLNSESGAGWYSTLSPQSTDDLLKLLQNIDSGNAEKIVSE